MSRYSNYVDRLEENEKKRKTIIGIVVGVLVLTFIVGCIWGLLAVLESEGTVDKVALVEDVPDSLSQEKDILEFVASSLENAASKDLIVKAAAETYLEIDGGKIEVGDSDADNALEKELAYAKDKILENIKGYDIYAKKETAFGDDLADFIVPVLFTEDEADVSISLGQMKDGALSDTDKFYFKAVFGEYALEGLPAEIAKSFNCDSAKYDAIEKKLVSDFLSVAEITDSNITCKNFELSGDINVSDNRINGICYSRLYEVELTVNFVGSLAGLGEKTLRFPLSVYEIHSFTYVGIALDAQELWLEKGSSEVIEVKKVHGDGEMTVSFVSSDVSVATVDEKGYVKGKSYSDKPVTVTVTAEYFGKTYTKQCTVYVRHAVEGVELEEDVVTLCVGDTKTLVPVFEPQAGVFSKAPEITGVKWYVGEDENGNSYSESVTVDENGVVTVIADNAAHYAEVYCVTDDGHFKATCEITISAQN